MSKKKSAVDPTRIKILKLAIAKANIEATDAYLADPRDPVNSTTAFGTNIAFDPPQKLCRARLTIDLQGVDKQKQLLGLKASYDLLCDMKVENLQDLIHDDNGNLIVDGQLAATLMGIFYSTARGIILERTSGTFFGGVILPVIDPKQLVQHIPQVPAPIG
ncbi:MAG TPA: hypothetical protein PKY96_16950 [Flavobacteriales bacterium]|nr:hypothetical protein [Flavobacteriales bacterium]